MSGPLGGAGGALGGGALGGGGGFKCHTGTGRGRPPSAGI